MMFWIVFLQTGTKVVIRRIGAGIYEIKISKAVTCSPLLSGTASHSSPMKWALQIQTQIQIQIQIHVQMHIQIQLCWLQNQNIIGAISVQVMEVVVRYTFWLPYNSSLPRSWSTLHPRTYYNIFALGMAMHHFFPMQGDAHIRIISISDPPISTLYQGSCQQKHYWIH